MLVKKLIHESKILHQLQKRKGFKHKKTIAQAERVAVLALLIERKSRKRRCKVCGLADVQINRMVNNNGRL